MSCISHSGLGPSRIKCHTPPTDPNGPEQPEPVLIGWDPKTKTLPSQPGTRCISIPSLTQLLSDTKHHAARKPFSKPLSFDDLRRLKSLKALGAIERFTLYRRPRETDCKHLKSYFHAVSSCFCSVFGLCFGFCDFCNCICVLLICLEDTKEDIVFACCRKGPSKAENNIFKCETPSLNTISTSFSQRFHWHKFPTLPPIWPEHHV